MTLRSPIRDLFKKMSLGYNPSTRLMPLGHKVSVYGNFLENKIASAGGNDLIVSNHGFGSITNNLTF